MGLAVSGIYSEVALVAVYGVVVGISSRRAVPGAEVILRLAAASAGLGGVGMADLVSCT